MMTMPFRRSSCERGEPMSTMFESLERVAKAMTGTPAPRKCQSVNSWLADDREG